MEGELVSLRPLRLEDAGALGAVLRDGRVTRMLPPRVRRETGVDFVRRALDAHREGRGRAFAIRPRGAPTPIGQVRLFAWDRGERHAELGYWLRRKDWGRGYGTEAVRLACRYGFATMSLNRVEARVVAGNLRSAGALERMGFHREGLLRRSARLGRGWADEWMYGLLRGELRRGRSGPAGHRAPRLRRSET